MKPLLAPLCALALAACASAPPSLPEAGSAPRGIDSQLAEATVAPLTDLNIVRAEIPKALVAARAAPYALPADMSCPGLAADIQALDAVLGADLDTAETRDNPSLIERGGDPAGNALVGAVRDTTEGVVPFRGWVRKLSGAERYARKVSASRHPDGEASAGRDMTEVHMKMALRALLATAATLLAPLASAADGIAFITNLRGEVAVDGAARPLLMSELGKGQKITIGKESQLAVMYIQSGKEYVLKAPGDYTVGEREITAAHGMPPPARETPWRASSQVLVKVSQSSSASIRMRSLAPPPKAEPKPALEFPMRGAVTLLQPTLRWAVPESKGPVEITPPSLAGKTSPSRGPRSRTSSGPADDLSLLIRDSQSILFPSSCSC